MLYTANVLQPIKSSRFSMAKVIKYFKKGTSSVCVSERVHLMT
jgi:hypothetical protein